MDISIIIPCYNEALNVPLMIETLFPVVAEMRQSHSVEVLFVDDGSADETLARLREVAKNYPDITVIPHGQNRGLGAAMRTGYAHAQGDVVITTDSDGTYPFAEIPNLLALLKPGVDIVAASPYHPQGGIQGVPPYRLVLSQGASLLYRLLIRWDIHTYTAMFRVCRRAVARRVPSTATGFLMPAEFLSNAILLGHTVAEFPTTLHVRRYGQSKARVARIILAHLRFQAHLLGMRLTGRRPQPVPASQQGL
ncbi:MAG: glycosyltransferase family 2 protein [Anaerolineae bacterium]|nr:glycosyltransferase family 2 protein [Anaerolineae bacterium]